MTETAIPAPLKLYQACWWSPSSYKVSSIGPWPLFSCLEAAKVYLWRDHHDLPDDTGVTYDRLTTKPGGRIHVGIPGLDDDEYSYWIDVIAVDTA